MSAFSIKNIVIALTLMPAVAGGAEAYRFISGSDLFEALSQDSMMLKGYFLGVVDVVKDSQNGGCFEIPFAADADQKMVQSFLRYWEHAQVPEDPVDAITQAMISAYPCTPVLD